MNASMMRTGPAFTIIHTRFRRNNKGAPSHLDEMYGSSFCIML